MKVAREYRYLILTIAFSHAASFMLMGPKFYANQALPGITRDWSNLPYLFRSYQPSSPIQYYRRYFSDPYFSANLQSSDYFYSQDPYLPSFADTDNNYYANLITYYIPTGVDDGQRFNYYEPSSAATLTIDPIKELQDYEDEYAEEDYIPKSQREWRLDEDMPPNENTDYNQFNQINGILFGDNDGNGDMSKIMTNKPKLSKTKTEAHSRPQLKSRYIGIERFGHNKDRSETIYGNHGRSSRLNDDKYAWRQYDGIPAAAAVVGQSQQYDQDEDVNELKQLAKQSRITDEMATTTWAKNLAAWPSDNAKRKANPPQLGDGQKWEKLSNKPHSKDEPMHLRVLDDDTTLWKNKMLKETSVFDTIKRLLALEDRANLKRLGHKKRENQKTKSYKTTMRSTTVIPPIIAFSNISGRSTTDNSSNTDGTTAKEFPNFGVEWKPETSTPWPSSTVKISKQSDKKISVNNNLPYM